jgi:hypothetical protein
MPEYLAPGVYVEETSFRAKSIEGVGTSTTAFAGPTRKGPIASAVGKGGKPPALPELLTSFGDFVRTYGGLQDLAFDSGARTNYVAHAVLNFFNEGGTRLYVSRVANGAKPAALALAGDLNKPDEGGHVFVRARFPGETGNGTVTIREIFASATRRVLDGAPAGTLLRAAGTVASEPARISGGSGANMSVPDGAVLRLLVNRTPHDVTFHGTHTEATAANALANAVVLDDTNRNLTITLDGVQHAISIPAGNYAPAALALAINAQLPGGYARLTDDGKLVIGTDRRGSAGHVQVAKNAAIGFAADADVQGAPGAQNNLPDLANFNAADLNTVLAAQLNTVTAAQSGGRLAVSTVALGQDQTLSVADATAPNVVSAHAALGLTLPQPGDKPAQGSNVRLYAKGDDGSWSDGANSLALPDSTSSAVVGNMITLLVRMQDGDGEQNEYDDITFGKTSPRYIGRVLGTTATSRADDLQRLLAVDIGGTVTALQLRAALFPPSQTTGDVVQGFSASYTLSGGTSGGEPGVGAETDDGTYAAALFQLRSLEDVSIVAAPGHSSFEDTNFRSIQSALLSHVEAPRAYRIAVLDTKPNLLPGDARDERAQIDSTRAALYYPWITVANPLARPGRDDIPKEINLPPSGFLCGIYARNDVEQTVAKAPANEVVRGALRFESDVNFAQNQLLNPIGVNCLRYFPGRGYRVWGARTAGSDPEIKYVNVRRYLIYLEASIDQGTQWAVFENNGPRLWSNVTETIESFLYNEWVSGNLLGGTTKEAYFVRCDRSTITQNDLDNGRLICLIGVALLKPAEFVIFRIGQKTADARS